MVSAYPALFCAQFRSCGALITPESFARAEQRFNELKASKAWLSPQMPSRTSLSLSPYVREHSFLLMHS